MKFTIERIAKEFINEAKASPRMFEDLAAMEKYMAESYDGRAFVEILQNADDACSTKVEVFSCGDDYVVANNGRPFTETDITSICRSGASSKQRGGGIGYRGVGFKSATSISTEIIIYSSDSFFTFSKSQCAEYLGKHTSQVPTVRIPFPISSDVLSDALKKALSQHKAAGFTTFFIFRYANKEKLSAELSDVNCGWLLFLNHVGEIRIKTERVQAIYSVKRTQKREYQTLVKLLESGEQWLCVSDGMGASIAFRYDAGILPCQPEEALFHCYLPTLDSFGFPFKANADFSTDPSRKHVIISDELTKKNMAQIAKLIFLFITCHQDDFDGAAVINLMSSRIGISEAATLLERQVLAYLNEDPWLPLKSGNRIVPRDYKIMPEWVDDNSQKAIFKYTPSLSKYEIDGMFARKADKINALLLKTGATFYSLDEYLKILENVGLIANLSAQLLGKFWGYAFRSACYSATVLANCYFQNMSKQLIRLKDSSKNMPLQDDFIKSIEGVLSADEIEKLVVEIPAFSALTASQARGKTARSPAQRGNSSSSGLSKWKTPIQNCIAAEALTGYSGKDVSRKNLGYDVTSSNAQGDMKYISVKEVNALGDSFVLSEAELAVAQMHTTAFYIFLVTRDDPEHQYRLIGDIPSLTFDKRVREWEYLCTKYDFPEDKQAQQEYPIDATFMKDFSLKYLNKVQLGLLIAICDASDLTEFEATNSCKILIVSAQINSIADFYIGNALLLISPEGSPSINEKYYGSVRYMLKDRLSE